MDVIQSQVQPSSAEFKENHARMKALVVELKERLSLISKGGSQRAIELHRSRGKLLARERIEQLLDPGTPFMELSPHARYRYPRSDFDRLRAIQLVRRPDR